jgi:EAL domain-containing protein (putative c-di-GMP-specific phosphodiesterase class I)
VAPAAAPARAAPPVLSPQAIDDILEFELTPDLPPAAPHSQTQRLPALAAVKSADLSLDLPFAKSAAKPAAPVLAAAPAAAPFAAAPKVSAAPAAASFAAAPKVSAAPAAARANAAPVTAAPAAAAPFAGSAVHSAPLASLAESFDLNLPSLDPPEPPTVFAGNVAQFPSAAPTIPTATSSVSSGSTTTSKALTGTSKALSSADTSKAAGATTTSRVLALPDGVSLILEVLPFSKLRTGGRTRRYEVLARSSHPNRVPSGFDKIALQQLLAWMGTNRSAWSLEPTSFTLNLSIATLEDERFPQFVASQLKANGIAPDNIGFEIAEPLCLQRRAQVERFITLCDKLGCFVVIDDFSLDSSITGLLRSKALRLVKIDPKLTSVALKDKLAQAMVVAIAQAVKVLGIHCAAKRVESQASLQWLTAIGCDFAQGSALGQVQSLESLGTQPAPGPSQPA